MHESVQSYPGTKGILAGLIGCGLTSSYDYGAQQAGGLFLFLAFGALCVALIWYGSRANQITQAKAVEKAIAAANLGVSVSADDKGVKVIFITPTK